MIFEATKKQLVPLNLLVSDGIKKLHQVKTFSKDVKTSFFKEGEELNKGVVIAFK
jgi:hypothetical protein